MADAARPTPRAHARTPLNQLGTRGAQRRAVTSSPNMRSRGFCELLNYHIVHLGASDARRRRASMLPFSGCRAASWHGRGRGTRRWSPPARAAACWAAPRRWLLPSSPRRSTCLVEEFGCHLLEGLLCRCKLVQSLTRDEPAAVLGCAAAGHIDGPRLLGSTGGRCEALRVWPRWSCWRAECGGAAAYAPRTCCQRCHGTQRRAGRCAASEILSARSLVRGEDLNPDTVGALPSCRL